MRQYTKDDVKELAARLTATEDTAEVHKALDVLCPVVDAGISFSLDGEYAYLEPLLYLRALNMNSYAKVLRAIDDERTSNGLGKLGDKKGRKPYMAGYMRVKRSRENRLIDAWNMQFSEDRKLSSDTRKEFLRVHSKRWLDAKNAALAKARKDLCRTLTREEMQRILTEYDDRIDAELDEFEQFMRDEIRKPLSQRNPNGFAWHL